MFVSVRTVINPLAATLTAESVAAESPGPQQQLYSLGIRVNPPVDPPSSTRAKLVGERFPRLNG